MPLNKAVLSKKKKNGGPHLDQVGVEDLRILGWVPKVGSGPRGGQKLRGFDV